MNLAKPSGRDSKEMAPFSLPTRPLTIIESGFPAMLHSDQGTTGGSVAGGLVAGISVGGGGGYVHDPSSTVADGS